MTENITIEGFNLADPEIQKNPYPYYPILRAQQPVMKTNFGGQPCWILSRREEISTVLMDPATYSNKTTPLPNLLFADPPEHERLRGMVSALFTRTAVQPMASHITTNAERLWENALANGRCDIIEDVAGPLTISVIAQLLGMSVEEAERLRKLTKLNAEYVFALRLGRTPSDISLRANGEMTSFMSQLIQTRGYREDGVIAVLAEQHFQGALTLSEVIGFAILLLVAGHSTTTNLIGNSVYTLSQRPRDLQRLAEEAGFVTQFIEEVLRTRPSFHRIIRITTRDVELAGTFIPAGSILRILLASANRDPQFFADPEDFDPDAKRRMHFAFGQGIHSCLGAWLARLEAATALEIFARRTASVKLDPDAPAMPLSGGTFNEFGFEHLPVLLQVRAPA